MRTRLLLILCLGAVVSRIGAQDPPQASPPASPSVEIGEDGTRIGRTVGPPSEATLAILRSLQEHHGRVKNVEATFKQLKVSEIFLEEIESTGKFWFLKPDLFRCDYDPPDAMTNLMTEFAPLEARTW